MYEKVRIREDGGDTYHTPDPPEIRGMMAQIHSLGINYGNTCIVILDGETKQRSIHKSWLEKLN